MSKQNKVEAIKAILSGEKLKKGILIVSSKEPGIYEFRDEIYNEKEFEILKQGYEKTVVFVPVKNESNEQANKN
jgi:hypothetical protein